MDAVPPPEEELAALRRRAYGPDADIAGDPRAQARLVDLEHELAARDSGAPGGALSRDSKRSATAGVDTVTADAAIEPSQAAGDDAEAGLAATSATSETSPGVPARRMRRALPWVVASVATVVAAVALGALYVDGLTEPELETRAPEYVRIPDRSLPQDAPDYVLSLASVGADADDPRDPHGTLNRLGLSTDELRQYEDFRGLSVWSGESRSGAACLLVAHPGQGLNEGIGDAVCFPEGFDTIAELRLCGGCSAPEVFAGLPTGSLIQFALKGDHVDVYVRAADPIVSQG